MTREETVVVVFAVNGQDGSRSGKRRVEEYEEIRLASTFIGWCARFVNRCRRSSDDYGTRNDAGGAGRRQQSSSSDSERDPVGGVDGGTTGRTYEERSSTARHWRSRELQVRQGVVIVGRGRLLRVMVKSRPPGRGRSQTTVFPETAQETGGSCPTTSAFFYSGRNARIASAVY